MFIELHISESQASVYSSSMAAATRYKSRIPSTGLTNELYFASHKPDGDNERTPPALLRNRRRTPQSTIAPTDGGTPSISTTHRAMASPVRSTTYVLQQHHRVSNSSMARKSASPVQHHPTSSPSVTSTALNRSRQTPQPRTYSNHERLPVSNIIADPSAHQQFAARAQVTLTPRRTSPIVRNAPSKPTTLAGYSSRPPRVRTDRLISGTTDVMH